MYTTYDFYIIEIIIANCVSVQRQISINFSLVYTTGIWNSNCFLKFRPTA